MERRLPAPLGCGQAWSPDSSQSAPCVPGTGKGASSRNAANSHLPFRGKRHTPGSYSARKSASLMNSRGLFRISLSISRSLRSSGRSSMSWYGSMSRITAAGRPSRRAISGFRLGFAPSTHETSHHGPMPRSGTERCRLGSDAPHIPSYRNRPGVSNSQRPGPTASVKSSLRVTAGNEAISL